MDYKAFSDWWHSFQDREPSYQETFEAGRNSVKYEGELPELPPMQVERISGHRDQLEFYDSEDMQDYARQAIAGVREQALEEAKQVVLNFQAGWVPDGFTECADAIEQLKVGKK